MQYCASCGTKFEEGNQFCIQCGAQRQAAPAAAPPLNVHSGYVPPTPEAQAPGYAQPTVDAHGGKATAGLVLGIVSVVFSMIPILGLPLGILGIIFGALGMKSTHKKAMAAWGLGLGIFGIILSLIFWIVFAALAFVGDSMYY